MCFGWRYKWWLTANMGLRMLISSLDTQPLYESCWLTAKEMSPTVRDTATHCSSICAREARNLLLYAWEIHNQHSQRNALGFFTGLQQCIYTCFFLSWVDKVLKVMWQDYNPGLVVIPPPMPPCYSPRLFSSHRLDSLTLEAAAKTLILRERDLWLKDFRCTFLERVSLLPRTW